MSLLWVRAAISIVPVTPQKQQRCKTGMVPIRMEQANIFLFEKKKEILMKVHIDVIN